MMERVLLIRYGEISLKGRNRRQFESKLEENIVNAISVLVEDAGKRVSKSHGRFYVTGLQSERLEKECLEVLSCVPGIVAISPGVAVESELDAIKHAAIYAVELAKRDLNPPATFKVDTRRADKGFPLKSPEVNQEVGAAILRNVPGLTVDVHNPSIHLNVEIRPGRTYIYRGQVQGPGGLPVGTSGRGVLLLSGGIDSPVAGYLAMKRGVAVDALHFWSYPITGVRARDKVVDLCKALRKYSPDLRLLVAPFTKIQTEIMDKCPEKYRVIIMRRMMMRVASMICRDQGGLAIFTGDNLGQVASQTLESLRAIERVSEYPVLRPLLCFDKVETVRLAQQIGTYDISILPYEDCCSVFVPKHPVTKPRLDAAEKAETLLDVDELARECAMNIEVFDLG